MSKVRLQDVASKAGVSVATVSNVLNNRKGVSKEVAEKILRLCEEMGYVPASAEPQLKKSIRLVVTKKHGLVVINTQFFTELIEGIEAECRNHHIDLMITHLQITDTAETEQLIESICTEDCLGIILLATELCEKDLKLFTKTRSPLVVLDNTGEHLNLNTVVIDNYEAGYLAGKMLIEKGHKRIGHITSAPGFPNMAERKNGFFRALHESGSVCPEEDRIALTPTIEGAFRDMDRWLSENRSPEFTAVFAANDILALGAVQAFSKHGIRVPEDISVIGMDDLSFCQIARPNLSTIHVPRRQLGKAAVLRLIQIAEHPGETQYERHCVGVRPVNRESVKSLSL